METTTGPAGWAAHHMRRLGRTDELALGLLERSLRGLDVTRWDRPAVLPAGYAEAGGAGTPGGGPYDTARTLRDELVAAYPELVGDARQLAKLETLAARIAAALAGGTSGDGDR